MGRVRWDPHVICSKVVDYGIQQVSITDVIGMLLMIAIWEQTLIVLSALLRPFSKYSGSHGLSYSFSVITVLYFPDLLRTPISLCWGSKGAQRLLGQRWGIYSVCEARFIVKSWVLLDLFRGRVMTGISLPTAMECLYFTQIIFDNVLLYYP